MPFKAASLASPRRRKSLKFRDKDRFHCPYPGCGRSCAELWRLKVHYRAPSNIRGSGVERGHGIELEFCPKCGEKLEVGRNHGQCRPRVSASGVPGPPSKGKLKGDEALPTDQPITAESGLDLRVAGAGSKDADNTPSVSDRFGSNRTVDELSSFVSRSSVESGHLVVTTEERDLSAFSSPSCLNDAIALAQLEDIGTADFASRVVPESAIKAPPMQPWQEEISLEDEFIMPSTFIPELDKRAVELHLDRLQTDSTQPGDLPCLLPISELVDLATYEAGVLQMLSARAVAMAAD